MARILPRLILAVTALCTPSLMAKSILYVDAHAPVGGDGSSWSTSYRYLQDALSKARLSPSAYSAIWIATGTYCPDRSDTGIVTPGDRGSNFRLVEGVPIYGGFSGLEEPGFDLNHRLVLTNQTVFSGDLAQNDFTPQNRSENSYHVVVAEDVGPTAILDGVWICAGQADGSSAAHADEGGGLHCLRSSPTIRNCLFTRNYANWGGALATYTSGSPTLVNCVFTGNEAWYYTTIDVSYQTGLTMYNCTVAGNAADGYGPALSYDGKTAVVLTNCILWGNKDPYVMSQWYQIGKGWSDSPQPIINHCCIQGLSPTQAGTGNIGSSMYDQPRFARAPSLGPDGVWGTIDDDPGDLRLRQGSHCIDAGTDSVLPTGLVTDVEGSPRRLDDSGTPDRGVGSPTVDMGAYEFSGTTIPVDPSLARLFVRTDGPTDGDGSSWSRAFRSLQDALDTSILSSGTVREIWVAAGTYLPDDGRRVQKGDRYATFECLHGIALYGGFAGNEIPGQFDLSQRDFVRNQTVLSGDLAGTGGPDSQSSTHVVVVGSDSARLDGFTIQYGNASGEGLSGSGGGLYVPQYSPTIANCRFWYNVASISGGAAFIASASSPKLERCTFSTNTARNGGALYSEGKAALSSCAFVANVAQQSGGAVCSKYAATVATGCRFLDNHAEENGGACAIRWGTLTNCILWGNSANQKGGGVYNEVIGDHDVDLFNCTLVGNRAATAGGLMNQCYDCSGGQYTDVTNCIFWNNQGGQIGVDHTQPRVTHCCIQGGWTGEGNIDADPMFVNASAADLRLMPGSPCVDAGLNSAVPAGVFSDIDGKARFIDSATVVDCRWAPGTCGNAPIVDMGAHEYGSTISGRITTQAGAAVPDAVINGAPGQAITDANGNYYVGVPDGWSGTLTPSKLASTFSPASRTYSNVLADVLQQDFTAEVRTSISGRVTLGGIGMAGVVMTGLPGNPQTDASGDYAVEVPFGWTGTVTPTKTGYTFSPATRSYTNITSSQAAQDYATAVEMHVVAGHVTLGSGPLAGVVLSGFPGNPQTNTNGDYSVSVPYGWSGTVTPTKAGYVFSPANRIYDNLIQDVAAQHYAASVPTFTISGRITFNGAGMPGVLLSGSPGDIQTDADGQYTFTVAYGWSKTIIPTKEGFVFNPLQRTYSKVSAHAPNQDYAASSATPYIRGYVRCDGIGISGVQLSGLPTSVSTISGGYYAAKVTYGWSGTVTPVKDGYTFSPVDRTYANVTADLYTQDFTASSVVLTLTGHVDYNGTPLPGVTMAGLPGNPQTDANGDYVASVKYGWSGTVTPTKAAYAFSPASRTYASVTTALTSEDYTASDQMLTVSGRVTLNGTAVPGVIMSGLPGNPETNSAGQYTATLPYNWTGTVTPTKAGFTFAPLSRTYTGLTDNQSNQNYDVTSAVLTISGRITIEGESLQAVTLSGLPGNPQTDANGQYAVNVSFGWSGTVTPIKAGYVFSPASRSYSSVTSSLTQDYTAANVMLTVSGRVTLNGAAVAGVTMSGLPGNPETNSAGQYTGTVPYNWSGTVTPNKPGLAFSPLARTYANLTQNQVNQDYTAGTVMLTIAGRLTMNGAGLAGVTLSGLPGNPQTGTSGNYSATVPYGWSGSITPNKTGYAFTPANRVYMPMAASQSNQDFAASLLSLSISGRVTCDGQALPDVALAGLPEETYTDADGRYTATITYGWAGSVSPKKLGYAFAPVSHSYSNVTANQTNRDFVGTVKSFIISGHVTRPDGGAIAGIKILGLPGDPTTDKDGNYFVTVPFGWSGSVSPTLPGYSIEPESRAYVNVHSDFAHEDYIMTPCPSWFRDADGDGYGTALASKSDCTQPQGYVADNTDCDDSQAQVHPGAQELCADGIDNDCDSQIDEGCPAKRAWFRDQDGDGYGDVNSPTQSADRPTGYVTNSSDCDDTDADVHPMAADICGDGIDQDCSGLDTDCALSDSDQDGVPDDFDSCPGSTAGASVDAVGCAASQRDSDGDSVNDANDDCPQTARGIAVDERGCPTQVPSFTLRVFTTDGAAQPAPALFTRGALAQVYAPEAPTGYRFSHWSGDAGGSDNPITVTMDRDRNLTANYVLVEDDDPAPDPVAPATCGLGLAEAMMGVLLGLTFVCWSRH